jgi:type I restriction enzyme S subunit
VCRVVPGPSLDRHYLAAVLESPAAQAFFRDATRTLAQPTLNVGLLGQVPIPLPPLPEQRRIVADVDRLHERMESLECLQVGVHAELGALLPSVLDSAFAGEL